MSKFIILPITILYLVERIIRVQWNVFWSQSEDGLVSAEMTCFRMSEEYLLLKAAL